MMMFGLKEMNIMDVSGKVLIFITLLQSLLDPVFGGHCWRIVDGQCRNVLMTGVSQQTCCSMGGAMGGWTEEEGDSRLLMIQLALGRGSVPTCHKCFSSCSEVRCGEGKVCRVRGGVAKCVCRGDCNPQDYSYSGPVCGFDENTYKNICKLKRYNCRHDERVSVNYRGRCQNACSGVKCEKDKNCVVDQNHTPHCIQCRMRCPSSSVGQQVCGTDGFTYDNRCKVFEAACLSGKSIKIAYSGPCRDRATCEDIRCGSGETCVMDELTQSARCINCYCSPYLTKRVICGTDGETYNDWCELRNAMCTARVLIETLHSGRCRTNQSTDTEDYPGDDLDS